ncbi:MAG: kynureninase [Candidatus Dormibacteria bacterium]
MSIDRATCARRDAASPLRDARQGFVLPEGLIYLDGNSLGPLAPAVADRVRRAVEEEWGVGLIGSWSTAAWMDGPARVGDKVARLVGADPGEVVVGDSTTVVLYKLVRAALAMRPGRRVVLTEAENFHTDLYAAAAAATDGGGEVAVVERGELLQHLDEEVAALLLTHVDFRTGEVHDMAALSAAAHEAGALALWDLSHSAGAMPLALGDDGADMAAGCGYKYLNGGPGAPAFLYVRGSLQGALENPVPGWIGHAEPFRLHTSYRAAPGIRRMLSGTPPVLALSALEAAVDAWLDVDLAAVRQASLDLTDLLIELVEERCAGSGFTLRTPREHRRRGSQVAFAHPQGAGLVRALAARGVISDFRAPDVCRFGIAPLYVGFVDVWDAVDHLVGVLASGDHLDPR